MQWWKRSLRSSNQLELRHQGLRMGRKYLETMEHPHRLRLLISIIQSLQYNLIEPYHLQTNQMKIQQFLLLAILIGHVGADTCGGANCPSGKCPTCYCGREANIVDVSEWCSKYSWNQNCCKCIILHQSGGNANAMNYNNNGSTYIGLFQINTMYWQACSNAEPPCSPTSNLKCAIKLYSDAGNKWTPWKTKVACGC